jgi:AraC-like DNA-binding protein
MVKIILLLNPVYVTLFWAMVLTFQNKKQTAPKLFLGRFMLVACLLYFTHLLYFTGQMEIYYYLDSIYILVSLMVYPLYHIYVRLLTVDQWFSLKDHGRFLILPLLIFAMHLTGYVLMSKPEGMYYLTAGISGMNSGTAVLRYQDLVYQAFRAGFIVQVLFFLLLNFRLIIRHNNRIADYFSNLEDRSLTWLQFFNFSLAATSLASVAAAILGRDIFSTSEIHLAVPSVLFSLMLFVIGFLGNIQKEVNIVKEIKAEKWSEKAFQPGLKKRMETLFEKEMIFSNPDLKIWDLCNMLGTNRTYVSRVINNDYSRNFCNHVNHYRVMYAKKLLAENRELGNDDLAELSGFGSVNSLYRAFASSEGISLGEFRKNQEK